MTYLILSAVTIPVLIYLAAQDLKERMIYSFPVLLLSVVWAAYSIYLYRDRLALFAFAWTLTVALHLAYKHWGVWGDGDSDMFLLFSGIIMSTFDLQNMLQFCFLISVLVVFVQVAALVSGIIEAVIKKRKLNKHSDLAVIPGFALTLSAVMILGIIREVSFI